MSYHLPNSGPPRPSTPQMPRYPSQPPDSQYSRSPSSSHGHPSLNYSTPYSQSPPSPRRLCSPPRCASPLSEYRQPDLSPQEYLSGSYTGSTTHRLQRAEQRRHSISGVPDGYRCSKILNTELEKPRRKSATAAALAMKVSRYPETVDPISHLQLLQMFQQLYGEMLDSVKHATSDLLRIQDPNAVSCRAHIYRFDKRDKWRVYKSRPGAHDRFYCAPHIEVTLPYFPTRSAIKEIIAAISDKYGVYAKHMQPAYKFKAQERSWKFEPGAVYELTNAEQFIVKPLTDEHGDYDSTPEEDHQEEREQKKLITYPDPAKERRGGSEGTSTGVIRKECDIKDELRLGPNMEQCKQTVRSLLANEFGLDSRKIEVWFWVKEVELHDKKWYPWGSLDNTYGLTIASQDVVQYNAEDAKKNARKARRPSRGPRDKEPRVVAPIIRVFLPVERKKFAKDEENVKGLKNCVESIRSQMSTTFSCHSRAAFSISWEKEKREFADWFAPKIIYKPVGDGDSYLPEEA
ncbi:hypothetical protein F4777DRAFT_470460 [Nemania sp. FL0916]|nr:hypothetical protein F4777DRAFT_470460 [Nemania sp. FL0916]